MRHREEDTTAGDHTARGWQSQDSNAQIPVFCPRGAALGGPQVATEPVKTRAPEELVARAPWRPRMRGGEGLAGTRWW